MLLDSRHPPLSPARRGFTLVELLVVIGIIVALVAILIPALGHVKRKGYDTATNSTLMSISKAVDTYYSTFNGYPGPLSVGAVNANSNKASGAQNLLLGLCYPMLNAGAVQLPGAGGVPTSSGYSNGIFVNPAQPQGPRNYAQSGTGGLFEQLQPFFALNLKALSPNLNNVWPNGGITGAIPSNSFAFPVLMDNYTDGLPILFYRRTPGVSTPVARTDPAAGLASFFLSENSEYTTSPGLTSSSGTIFDQTKRDDGSTCTLTPELFQAMFRDSGGTAHTRGGYLLLSAGPDRRYGVPDLSPGKPGIESDNIFQIGGN